MNIEKIWNGQFADRMLKPFYQLVWRSIIIIITFVLLLLFFYYPLTWFFTWWDKVINVLNFLIHG